MQSRSGWRISIGSSIVTMCWCRVRLMWSSIAASVVVLPEPVAPVTSTSPRCSSARRRTPGGRLSISKFGTFLGMTRNAKEMWPRCRKAFTRKRGRCSSWYAMSRSPVEWNASYRSGERLPTISSTDSTSRSVTIGASSSGPSEPSRRRIGGTPTFRWMSLAPSSTARLSRGLSSIADLCLHRHVRRGSLGGARQHLNRLHRSTAGALGSGGMGDLAEHQLLEHAPRDRQAHDREHRTREAVERALCTPAGRGERIELPPDGGGVLMDTVGDDVLGREPRRHEAFV